MKALCGVCDMHMEANQRFAFCGWFVHRRCATESVGRTADMRDDRFGVVIRGGIERPCRITYHLTEVLPGIHRRYERTTAEGAGQQQQLEIVRRPLTSGVKEITNKGEVSQHMRGGRKESDET